MMICALTKKKINSLYKLLTCTPLLMYFTNVQDYTSGKMSNHLHSGQCYLETYVTNIIKRTLVSIATVCLYGQTGQAHLLTFASVTTMNSASGTSGFDMISSSSMQCTCRSLNWQM